MGTATQDRQMAAHLPEGDVIKILLNQHALMKDLLDEVEASTGSQKHDAFEELRGLIAVHETAEEMVLRPATERIATKDVAEARNSEEKEANVELKQLESMDTESVDFDREFTEFKAAVIAHAENEESEEFPAIIESCSPKERYSMGRRIKAVEGVAPTRPHPSTAGSPAKQWTVGPFAALIDRTRDAINNAR